MSIPARQHTARRRGQGRCGSQQIPHVLQRGLDRGLVRTRLSKVRRRARRQRKVKPPAKTLTAIQGDIVYSQTIASATTQAMQGVGWTISGLEKVTTPVSDWTPVIGHLASQKPAIVYNAHPAPADQAAFMKQFVASPTPSLVYLQYGPSIPLFLQLAGPAATRSI